jgi:hypothetical protein
MALFRSERGIGRGEVPESRIEVPIFAAFMILCSILVFVVHLVYGNQSITIAIALSIVVFGVTVVRVEAGLYILILSMLLSPEIVAEANETHNLNVRYDDLLIMVIFLGVMVKLAFEGKLIPWQPSPINMGILAYYSICLISSGLALERSLGAWNRRDAFFVLLKMLEFYLIFFLAGHAVRNLRDIRNQMFMFFVVAIIVSLYAIYTIPTESRVGAPFDEGGTEPNTLGGYLTIILCLLLGLFTQAPGYFRKFALASVMLLATVPFLYTLSRASYVSFIVAAIVISVISRKYALILVLAAVLGTSSIFMPEKIKERVTHTFQKESGQEIVVGGTNTGVMVDKSTNERILVWRKVRFLMGLSPQYFLLGAGVSWESVLDSQYARIFLETGTLGMLAFIFMQYRILKTVRQAYRWTDDWMARGIAMGMFGAVCALISHGMGTISFLIVRIMEPYWFLLAICVVIRADAIEKHWTASQARKRVILPATHASAAMSPVRNASIPLSTSVRHGLSPQPSLMPPESK